MNILYICGTDPRESDSGTKQRTNFLWNSLKSYGQVYTVVASREAGCKVVSEPDRIKKSCFNATNWVGRIVERLAEGLLKVGQWPFHSRRYAMRHCGWGDVDFDLVVVRYLTNASISVAWKIAPMVVDVDDMPSSAFEELCKDRIPMGLRTISKRLVNLWQRYILSRALGAWIVNSDDKWSIPKGVKYEILMNRAKLSKPGYALGGRQVLNLITVGLMSYKPNREGVDWFIKEVWPEIHKENPLIHYQVVGGEVSSADRLAWGKVEGVEVLGFVDDLDTIYEQCIAVVAPIKIGAGSCIKVVEAPLRGRKIFATPFAAHALSTEEKDSLGVDLFETVGDFKDKLDKWLRLPLPERERLQESYYQVAMEYNSFDKFEAQVGELVATTLRIERESGNE